MISRDFALRGLLGLALAAAAAPQAMALDEVIRRSTEKSAQGDIESVSRTEVVVQPRVGEAITVPANDIVDVNYDAAPPAQTLARSQEANGQFDLAIKSYQQAASESAAADANLQAEIAFSIARTNAKIALADPAQLPDAQAGLLAFTESNRDHYRFYEAQLLLGDVALANSALTAANAAYSVLADAPWTDHQMAGEIGKARILFARDDIAGAKEAFDKVAATDAADAGQLSRKLEGMLGQAKCLQAQSQHDQAVVILDEVVSQSSERDTRLQAEAYLRQGESFAALGDRVKEAILAYLHVDVVPTLSQHGDFHAEALYHLAQLWPAAGQPARAAEAAGKLEQTYPNSEWVKKLAGGG